MVSPSLVVMVEGGTGLLGEAGGGGGLDMLLVVAAVVWQTLVLTGLVMLLVVAAVVWKTFVLTMSLWRSFLFLVMK